MQGLFFTDGLVPKHPLQPYLEYIAYLYRKMDPPTDQERFEVRFQSQGSVICVVVVVEQIAEWLTGQSYLGVFSCYCRLFPKRFSTSGLRDVVFSLLI